MQYGAAVLNDESWEYVHTYLSYDIDIDLCIYVCITCVYVYSVCLGVYKVSIHNPKFLLIGSSDLQ